MQLTKTQKKFLRKKVHHLKPVVWIGQHGLTENVVAEIDAALNHHELIKIKLRVAEKPLREKTVDDLCRVTGAEHVQSVGNMVSIYRRNSEQPAITLPK